MTGHARLIGGVLGLSMLSGTVVAYLAWPARPPTVAPTVFVETPTRPPNPPGPAHEPPAQSADYAFSVPAGRPSSLSCDEARVIVKQMRGAIAYAPPVVAPTSLAAATSDWLDPTGLWSASPDSPIPAAIDRHAGQLLHELENEGGPCLAANAVGDALVAWVTQLTSSFDRSWQRERAATHPASALAIDDAAGDAPFEDESRPAERVAATLGENLGLLQRSLGDAVTPYADAARTRLLPSLDREGWAGVTLAAAVRAYAQVLEPHAAWAPRDEEASVYDVDLDAHPPDRLWDKAVRTALGVRVESSPMQPLEVGDVVLAIGGVATAGLPPEQLDQLVYATTDTPASAPIVVLRRGEQSLRTLELPAPDDLPFEGEPADPLPSYRVAYGAGDALVIEIHDVRTDLGDELAATVHKQQALDRRPLEGLVLDLRDDGGGSTEGAIRALGLFLPGAPLFPMVRRDGSIEVDRAPEPALADRWTGPVATLVDGDTASAAEMIAGALLAYRRGPVVGRPTYGKGCAQEYLDDDAHVGVLRLTTLLYALPDGSPVQQVGLEPSVLLPLDGTVHPLREREGDVPNAPPTWRGPDVRDRGLVPAMLASWPEHHGKVGPCRDDHPGDGKDAEVCRALFALGVGSSTKRPAAALTGPGTTPSGGRPQAGGHPR